MFSTHSITIVPLYVAAIKHRCCVGEYISESSPALSASAGRSKTHTLPPHLLSSPPVVGDAESALFVGQVQNHVHPGPVLLGPGCISVLGALLEQRISDLAVDVLLL